MTVSKVCRLDMFKLNDIPLTLSALLPILADESKTLGEPAKGVDR